MKILKRFLYGLMAVIMLSVAVSANTISLAASKKVKNISLNKSSVTLYVGDCFKLVAIVSPSDATNKQVRWTSSDKNVATVSSVGKVTAKKAGSTTVSVKAKDGSGKKATCKIVVKKRSVSAISLNKTKATLKVNGTLALKAMVKPSNATNKKVKWSSDNTKVATVNSKGVVTAKKSGTATITATTIDQNKKATCKIIVNSTTGSSAGSTNSNTSNVPQTGYVWVPVNGGTKYHANSSCSNMKNPRKVTVKQATQEGFTPCGRCY